MKNALVIAKEWLLVIIAFLVVLHITDTRAETKNPDYDNVAATAMYGYVIGSFGGSYIGAVASIQPVLVNGVQATTAAGAPLYYAPFGPILASGFVGAISGAAVMSSSYVVADAIQEKGIKRYHKEVIAYYQPVFDITIDFYKNLFK